jgi:hypothetical protein
MGRKFLFFPAMDEQDFSKLSLEEKCTNKSWKARLIGYEELIGRVDKEFVYLIPGIIKDNNQIALETGLLVVQKYLELSRSSIRENLASLVLSLSSSRSATKERAMTIILDLIHLEGSAASSVLIY